MSIGDTAQRQQLQQFGQVFELLRSWLASAGGKLVYQYKKKPTAAAKCPVSGAILNGVSFTTSVHALRQGGTRLASPLKQHSSISKRSTSLGNVVDVATCSCPSVAHLSSATSVSQSATRLSAVSTVDTFPTRWCVSGEWEAQARNQPSCEGVGVR